MRIAMRTDAVLVQMLSKSVAERKEGNMSFKQKRLADAQENRGGKRHSWRGLREHRPSPL